MREKKPVYNRLKVALAMKRMQNKELAERLDVSEQTVSKWCTNSGQPSLPQLFAIARILQMKVCDLIEPMD